MKSKKCLFICSGAGKTTLLNALSFRSPSGVQISPSAERTLNGIPISATQLRSRCAYVQQDDLFIGSLSAREHLIFQAMLRLDRKIPYKLKLEKVEEVIKEVGSNLYFFVYRSKLYKSTVFSIVLAVIGQM